MKYKLILLLAFLVALSSCAKPERHEVPWEDLKGTQWKLYEIRRNYGHSDDRIIKLEPQDCENCYTLTFDEEKTGYATGVSIENTVDIQVLLGSEIPETGLSMVKVSVTELDEPFDGNQYCDFMRSVTIIFSTGFQLELYVFDDDNRINYLLIFERINP